MTVLYPTHTFGVAQKDEDTNEGSLVVRFEYGETSFLLTGDLPREEFVLGKTEPVTVLKAAHHGSRFSTSDAFVDMIQPKEAIISVGQNTYGHPHPSVMERLQKRGIRIHRTDEEGSITYQCVDNRRCEYRQSWLH
jgi:competence protein ComEC